jgi:large subunit ribosomal protein L21
MYAVIVSGGKQYRVREGQVIQVEMLDKETGSSVKFDNVLMIGGGDTSNVKVGAPYVKNSSVEAEVVAHGRGDKITIIKMKRRKHHMKRMGHRQWFTELKITKIVA